METVDDEEIVLPIPADRETVRLLVRLARAAGKHPIDCAAELLFELLRDDNIENVYHIDTIN